MGILGKDFMVFYYNRGGNMNEIFFLIEEDAEAGSG
jgi:hypothetical protein